MTAFGTAGCRVISVLSIAGPYFSLYLSSRLKNHTSCKHKTQNGRRVFGAIVATVENFALIPSKMSLVSFFVILWSAAPAASQHNTIRRQTNLTHAAC